MNIRLDNVYDMMARTVINTGAAMEQGSIAQIKGLAQPKVQGVLCDGQAFEVETAVAGGLLVLIAGDEHDYDNDRYNDADIPATPANEPVRAYIFAKGQTVTVEEAVLTGGSALNAGDKLVVTAGKLAKGSTAPVAMVLEKVVLDGKAMAKIIMM